MKKVLLLTFLFVLLFASAAMAHVANEKTIYDDIEFSEAKEQIVFLRGVNVIAHEKGANLFKPQDQLTRADLAFWAAAFKGLGGHDAIKEDLQKAAIEKGLIGSLEGNATFADVNKAYFDGKANPEQPDSEMTREQFALFMGTYLKEQIDGKTLFDMAGYEPGPSGAVEKVSFVMEGEGENAYKVFRYTIGGKEYQVSQHPKILYGPVDLGLWEGKKIKESWLAGGHGEEKEVQIIVVEQGQFGGGQAVSPTPGEPNDQATQDVSEEQQQAEVANNADSQPQTGFPVLPLAGGIVLVAILIWLLAKRRK